MANSDLSCPNHCRLTFPQLVPRRYAIGAHKTLSFKPLQQLFSRYREANFGWIFNRLTSHLARREGGGRHLFRCRLDWTSAPPYRMVNGLAASTVLWRRP